MSLRAFPSPMSTDGPRRTGVRGSHAPSLLDSTLLYSRGERVWSGWIENVMVVVRVWVVVGGEERGTACFPGGGGTSRWRCH